MICRVALSAVALAAVGLVGGAGSNDGSRGQPVPSKPDRSYGTALQWESKLETSAKKAARDQKLLMVLAVAGHFEDPFFT